VALHEPRLVQRREVLRDGLPRDGQFRRELRRRRGFARGECLDDEASIRIGERVEDAPGGVGHA
jgi:hypothetical protein